VQSRSRLFLIAAGAAAVVVLFILLRPDETDDPSSAGGTTTTAATTTEATTTTAETTTVTTTTTATTTTTPTTTAEPQPAVLRVTVRGGRPVGGIQRTTVTKNERVRIVVRSDVSDHVHLHGYDVMRDVAPGAPAQLAVDTTLTGIFEIELEDRRLHIAELEVRP
jgi:cytoskeletal protein RodZ